MKTTLLLVLLFFSIIFNGYAQVEVIKNPERGIWQDRENSPISFELVQTFGTDFPDESAVLSSPMGIQQVLTDSSRNVYILDYGGPMLVKFSPNGAVIWKIDRRGRGPGDLYNPLGMALNEEHVYVANLYGTRIDIFDTSGSFQKSINTEENDGFGKTLSGMVQDSLLVFRGSIPGKIGARIFLLNARQDFELINQFDVIQNIDHDYNLLPDDSHGPTVHILGDNIVVGGEWSYSNYFYKADGTLEKVIKRDFPRFFKPGFYREGDKSMLVVKGAPKGVYKVADKYLAIPINWSATISDSDQLAKQLFKREFPDLALQHSFDFYSAEGELLYSIENDRMINDIGIIKHSDSEGYLYTTVGEPYPQVMKYQVILKDL